VHPGPGRRAAFAIAAALPLLLAACCGAARAGDDPPPIAAGAKEGWLTADKQLHASGSLAIAASIRVAGGTEWQSFGGAVGVGILKEAYDAARRSKRAGRGASWKDLVADILGAAAGVALVAAMDR
jgi:uncharacterized protein YfiM (DUF2279 family)